MEYRSMNLKRRIVIIQPVLAPYVRQRLEELAQDENLEIYLLIENRSFSHRPGWSVTEVKGCKIAYLKSIVKREKIANSQYPYSIDGIRSIPYNLPFVVFQYRPHVVLVCNATELAFCYPLKRMLDYRIGLFVEDTMHAVRTAKYSSQRMKSIAYRRVDFYLPMSDESVAYLKHIKIVNSLYRTSWSIDFEHFSNAFDLNKCQRIKRELGLMDKTVFLYVGRLIQQKGVLNLIHAWRKLPPEVRKELALVIIGDGVQRAELQNFIFRNKLSNIFLLGRKSYEEIVDYYYIANVFILPTLRDLFSIVIMEAMACSLPILTTEYNGAKELVKDGKNGYVFDPTQIDSIKDSICNMYVQRERLSQMGNVSLKLIRNYSHQKVIGDFRKILHSILKCNGSANSCYKARLRKNR